MEVQLAMKIQKIPKVNGFDQLLLFWVPMA